MCGSQLTSRYLRSFCFALSSHQHLTTNELAVCEYRFPCCSVPEDLSPDELIIEPEVLPGRRRVLYPSSSSFIRKADRPQVSTFSLTATIIVDKSFLRIQVIAYISTTDARNPSVPIFALSFLSLSLFLSSSRPFEGRVHALGRWTAFLSENHSGMTGAVVSGVW